MKRNNIRKHNNAIIVFTRVPKPGQTKTRLMPVYTPEECADLHFCFILDIAKELSQLDADIIVFYTDGEPAKLQSVFGRNAEYHEQRGSDLGQRMMNAFEKAFSDGYDKVVLMGSDVPELSASTITNAFDMLDDRDVVIAPSEDGGYFLIGMKAVCKEAFCINKYGTETVLNETVRSIEASGRTVAELEKYSDIDEPEDIEAFIDRMRKDARLRNSNTGRWIGKHRKISIIVPTYNEESTIEGLLSQLRQYKDESEIIIVDGGSTDNTTNLIGDEFRVISCDKSRAIQMNAGARASKGDVLLFLHADCKLPDDAISEVRRCMVKHEYACFGIKFESSNFFMWTNRIFSNLRAWLRGIPFGDQGLFIDRKLFFKMGMFPEIPIMEDYELSRRLKSRGIKPGITRNRIIASDRRYPKDTIGILKTEIKMWEYRRMYRNGVDVNLLAEKYGEAR